MSCQIRKRICTHELTFLTNLVIDARAPAAYLVLETLSTLVNIHTGHTISVQSIAPVTRAHETPESVGTSEVQIKLVIGGAAAYQLGNTSSHTITEVKQR